MIINVITILYVLLAYLMNFRATHRTTLVNKKDHIFGDLLNICRRKVVDKIAVQCLEMGKDKIVQSHYKCCALHPQSYYHLSQCDVILNPNTLYSLEGLFVRL